MACANASASLCRDKNTLVRKYWHAWCHNMSSPSSICAGTCASGASDMLLPNEVESVSPALTKLFSKPATRLSGYTCSLEHARVDCTEAVRTLVLIEGPALVGGLDLRGLRIELVQYIASGALTPPCWVLLVHQCCRASLRACLAATDRWVRLWASGRDPRVFPVLCDLVLRGLVSDLNSGPSLYRRQLELRSFWAFAMSSRCRRPVAACKEACKE